ncbi:MAG: hypothetical protein Q8O10_06720 [candidate division Zixibacteria bacterium]|nr:hypothetical protein [candidate division Zixibacteria bacterium]
MKSKCFLIVAGLLLVLFSYSSAQVPQLINYQGKLTKASGAPLDTTISMVFSIYADSAGTILKWTETQGAVVVEKGIFNVLLGNLNPIPDTVFNGNIRYLGVKVGVDPEITPRKPMVSVPYAYRSATGAGDNDWTINGDIIYHLNGNVGIGTTVPSGRLHVADATGGNSSVILPNGSISAAEILDEPGVASNANSDGVAITSTALAIILSRTITAPAAGFVLVLGTTQFEVSHTTGTSDLYNIGVSGSSTALPANQDLFTSVIAALPTGIYQKVVSPHGLFVVSAGANTFYLLGEKVASTSVNATAFDSQLTLVFFPTAYGTVVGTFQNSASEQDDGAIDAPDRE